MKTQRYYFDIIDDYKKTHEVIPIPLEKVTGQIEYPCHLFLDQSTKTGFSIFDDKRRLITAGHIKKDTNSTLESYKFGLKEIIESLIKEYKISMVWYEEAYDKANHWTTEVLYYIKHMIKDLAYEYSQNGEDLRVLGLDHMKWKSLLAKPAKFKKTSDDKKQVKKLVQDIYPLINLEEDIMDSIGMGIAIIFKQTEKKVYYNARINKKLPVHVEVRTLKPGENVLDIVNGLGKRFTKKLDDKGLDFFEYNTEYDELLNCRYVLSFRDSVFWTKIPFHRNYGMILLHYGIVPKQLKDGEEIILITCRKK